jgi:hypothetical protein
MFGTMTSLRAEDIKSPPEMLEHWRRTTVSLGGYHIVNGKAEYYTIGSGIIIAVDEHHGCILTAKHIIYDAVTNQSKSEIRVRIPEYNGIPITELGLPIALIKEGVQTWKSLPDNSDIAVLPLPDLSRYSVMDALTLSDFASDDDDVYQGAPILSLGYPNLVGEFPLISPIARAGIIAWTDPSDRLGKRFLVDSNLYSGNSGGPVFHVRSGLSRYDSSKMAYSDSLGLIGMVVEVPLQKAPVRVGSHTAITENPDTKQPVAITADVIAVGGIGYVEPVSKIRRLVTSSCLDQ